MRLAKFKEDWAKLQAKLNPPTETKIEETPEQKRERQREATERRLGAMTAKQIAQDIGMNNIANQDVMYESVKALLFPSSDGKLLDNLRTMYPTVEAFLKPGHFVQLPKNKKRTFDMAKLQRSRTVSEGVDSAGNTKKFKMKRCHSEGVDLQFFSDFRTLDRTKSQESMTVRLFFVNTVRFYTYLLCSLAVYIVLFL